MAEPNKHPTSAVCSSPNRALWRSLTTLQEENSQLKSKVQSLERKTAGDRVLVSGGSSKFLRMELDREKSEAKALTEKLDAAIAAAAAAQASRVSSEAQLSVTRAELAGVEAELAAAREQLAAAWSGTARAAEDAAERTGEIESLRQRLAEQAAYSAAQEQTATHALAVLTDSQAQLQSKDRELTGARSQLEECRARLAAKEVELGAVAAELAEARSQLQGLRAGQKIVEAGLRSEVAQLEAALQQHLAMAAAVESSFQKDRAGGEASCPSSPEAESNGADTACTGLVVDHASCKLTTLSIPAVPSATVYNVMIDSPPEGITAAAQQEQERLTAQVLSLQDKLGVLQHAHEALLLDYGMVTEQLAARQAEVQLARLSPESHQLKQQVACLQSQVLSLQQELFASRSFSLSHLSPSRAPSPAAPLLLLEDAADAAGAVSPSIGSQSWAKEAGSQRLPTCGKEGRTLKRSFTRAASNIGRAMLGMRRQKSSVSLGTSLGAASRDVSFAESVGSQSHHSSSPYAASMGGCREDAGTSAGRAEAEALLLREQVATCQQRVHQLEARLAAEGAQQQLLQAAIMQQGEDLAEAREELGRTRAELEAAQAAWRQLTQIQGVTTKVCLPGGGDDHAKCREAVDMLFQQVWRERMARQKVEFQLEQQQSDSRRSTLTGVLDEEALERLQAEVAAADTLSAELRKAKGHQLQLQQWLQALQLQIAKQNSLLESARAWPSPGALQQRFSPSKDAIQLHNSLKAAEERAQEAELKLGAAERELAVLKRRERGMNQAIAQAAEWRKNAERRQEQARENWGRRLSAKQQELRQMEGRLHATAIAQKELLSGLEVLETLLRKKGEQGEARSKVGRPAGLTTPRGSSTDTQEALRQISSLLRTANTHLQILSPQQSDCISRGDLGSPRAPSEHLALSVTAAGEGLPRNGNGETDSLAWRYQVAAAGEGLSDPLEPVFPRAATGTAVHEELSGDCLRTDLAQQGLAVAMSMDDILQAILEGGGSELRKVAAEPAAKHVPAGFSGGMPQEEPAGSSVSALQNMALGEGFSSGLGSVLLHVASGGSSQAPGMPAGGSKNVVEASSAMDRVQLKSVSTSQGSSNIPAGCTIEPLPRQLARSPPVSPGYIPAHHPGSQVPRREAKAPAPAASSRSAGSTSPRMKALAAKISSGFKRMGCNEPKTRSGNSTPAGAGRRSAAGGFEQPSSVSGKAAGQRSTPLKPRKIWI